MRPGHGDLQALGLLDDCFCVRFAEVAIPERMADAVAAFDLDHCVLRAAVLALAACLVVDVTGADGSGLAFFAMSPEVRAEVGHR